MTSLELQLKRLKADAPAQTLASKRDYSSLLFDYKEAQNYSREEFYDIGLSGLLHLSKLDSQFDSYEAELFEDSKLEFNRALLQKEENSALNETLERFIVRLSPYFHHFSCKQVLEWLIHKYRIHAYNSEFLALAFLPYHTSNSYGRLLKILRFQNSDWRFTEEYAKNAIPISMSILINVCFSNNSFFLIPAYANYLVNSIKLVGDEYATEHLQPSFTFFASFMVHLFENTSKVNNQLISRAMPYVGISLKSKVLPFKCAGMMITTRIVLSAQLTDEILSNILKLTLLKVKKSWVDIALNTTIVICQTQKIAILPRKSVVKLLHNRGELDLVACLWKCMEGYDISAFFSAFWNTIFSILNSESNADERKVIASVSVEILDLEKMGSKNATSFIKSLLEFLSTAAIEKEDTVEDKILPQLRKHVRAIVIRFALEFDKIRAEWLVRDRSVIEQLMSLCQIELHEIGEMSIKKARRRRTSSCCSRKSFNFHEDPAIVSEVRIDEETLLSTEDKIKNAQAQVAEHRQPFRKSVLKILEMLEEKSDPDRLEWALSALSLPAYLKKQSTQELEEFFLKSVLFVSRNPKFVLKQKLKIALSQIKISVEEMIPLFSDLVNFESSQKRSKLIVKSTEERIADIFAGETCDQCERRIQFVLEVLSLISDENFSPFVSPIMIRKLFQLVEKEQCTIMNNTGSVSTADKDASAYIQQLCMGLVVKILEKSNTPFADSFILDALVKLIRFAHTPNVLPNVLKVLTIIAPIIPSQTVSQFMSLFTFMGNGIIRRDNEMTLKIFEDTLCALFGSVLKTDNGKTNSSANLIEFQQKLTEITRVFASSLLDIPAHRRMRILRVVLSTIPREYVWIVLSVLFEHFCSRWEKIKTEKNGTKKEHLDDVLLDPLLNFFDSFSL